MFRPLIIMTLAMVGMGGCPMPESTTDPNGEVGSDDGMSDQGGIPMEEDAVDGDAPKDEPLVILGSVDFRTGPASDFDTTGRTCISAHLIIPKVARAEHYAITATGFNDPLFFGTSISESLDPNNPRERDGGGQATPQIDEGVQWSQVLSGGCGQDPDMAFLMSRFDGIVVRIEVTLRDE